MFAVFCRFSKLCCIVLSCSRQRLALAPQSDSPDPNGSPEPSGFSYHQSDSLVSSVTKPPVDSPLALFPWWLHVILTGFASPPASYCCIEVTFSSGSFCDLQEVSRNRRSLGLEVIGCWTTEALCEILAGASWFPHGCCQGINCSLTVTGVGFYMLYFWLSDGNKTERCCTSDTFHRPRSFNLHFFLFLIMMPYFFQAPLHKLLPPFSSCQRFWESCLNLNLASRWNTPRRVWAQRRASWQSAQRWLNMSKISKLIQIDVSCLLPSSMDQILKSVT